MSGDKQALEEGLSEAPESFGEFLKRHREASGRTLEDIAQVTRISRRYLEAFENNDESHMPEEAFARGFLKNYAQEVGLDPDECLLRFDRFKRSTMPTQIRETRRSQSRFELGQKPKTSLAPVYLGGVVVIMVLVVAVWALRQWGASSEEGAESAVSRSSSEMSSRGGSSLVDQPEVTPSIVELKADQNIRLRMRLDEFSEQEILLRAGEEKSFEVFRRIEFRDPLAEEEGQEPFLGLEFRINERPMARPRQATVNILNQNIITSDDFMR